MTPRDDAHEDRSVPPGTLAWLRALLDDRGALLDIEDHGTTERSRRARLFAQSLAAVFRIEPGQSASTDEHALQSYRALREKIEHHTAATNETAHQRVPSRPVPWRLKHVATSSMRRAVAIPLVAGLTLAVGIMAATRRLHWHPRPANVAQRYAATRAERREVTLADGSTVFLDRSSTLTVAPDFGHGSRHISILGEAYITVIHRNGAPFVVTTGMAETRVLGTAFMVRKYPADRVAQIVVSQGRIAVHPVGAASQPTAILGARMLCQVTDSGALTVQRDVPIEDYTAWMHDRLIFRATPLRDVITELERVYSVPIRVADTTLFAQRVTLTVATGTESLAQVLDAFIPVIDAHYTRSDSLVTIMPGRRLNRALPSRPSSPLVLEKSYGR